MRRCVWAAMMIALVTTTALAGDAVVVWRAPGCFYPVLGWRMPVALESSDWRVDRAVTGLAADAYNCHFYTRLYLIENTQPSNESRWLAMARHDGVDAGILREAGLRPRAAGEPAGAGDIVLAGRPLGAADMVYTHSAIIRAVDEAGKIRTVRQKFDDRYPVVDVDWTEFRMLYAGMHPYRTEVWTWSESAYPQVVSR
jgi:hypothetical protein